MKLGRILIRVTSYIGYVPILVPRQPGRIQYVPRTLELANFTSLFRNQSSLKELEIFR